MLSVEALGLFLIALYLLDAVTVSEPGTTFVVAWRPGAGRVRRGVDVSLGRPRVIAWGSLLPPLDPVMIAEGDRFDAAAAADRHSHLRAEVWPIRALANLLFVVMAVLLPGAVIAPWDWYRPATIFMIVGGLWFALAVATVIASRRVFPDAESRPAVAATLLSPISAVRVVDVFARRLLAAWHPVVVAQVFCSRRDYLATARAACFSNPAGPAPPLVAFLRAAGDWEDVQAAPDAESGCTAFCPGCHAQFGGGASECPECRVALRSHGRDPAVAHKTVAMEGRT